MKIIVTDYQPVWAKRFEVLSQRLSEVIGDHSISIEHVGSTSVIGLPAKPVIDIDVVVTREKKLRVISKLEAYGYKHRGDLGIEDREAFSNPEFSEIDHHLYVCTEGSVALRNHLLLRDELRTNRKAMKEYGDIKKDLAFKYPNDIDSYISGKTEFIINILRNLGFNEGELSSVRKPNMAQKA